MVQQGVDPEKVTKPIQLVAAWFATLVLSVSAFLAASNTTGHPGWLPILCGAAAVTAVPFFAWLVFRLVSARNGETTSKEGDLPMTTSTEAGDGDRWWWRRSPQYSGWARDRELVKRVTDWIEAAMSAEREVALAFVEGELDARLVSYWKSAQRWRTVQIVIWLVMALLGLLVSVLAGLKIGRTTLIVAGALVATLTTFNQAMRPGGRADGFHTARLQLRDAAWDLLNHMGQYHKPNPPACYELFVKQVREIVQGKRSATGWDLT
jgi:hypothetical protein